MVIIIITNILVVPTMTKAAEEEFEITIQEEMEDPIYYQGDAIGISKILKSGENFVYSLNPLEEVVGNKVIESYYRKEDEILEVLKHGYPKVEYNTLQCESPIEAYIATQEAINSYLLGREVSEYQLNGEEEVALRIKNAVKIILEQISKEPEKSNRLSSMTNLGLQSEWQQDENLPGKKYRDFTFSTNQEIITSSFTISGRNDVIIQGKDGKEKTSFKQNDWYRVIVPLEATEKIEIKLEAQAQYEGTMMCTGLRTREKEYAILGKPRTRQIKLEISLNTKNIADVKLYNQDYETKQPIGGSHFQLQKSNGVIIMDDLITNEKGEIEIPILKAGDYQIKQTQISDQYELNGSTIPFTASNKSPNIQIEVNNHKKDIIEKENYEVKIIENEENHTRNQTNTTDITSVKTVNTYQNRVEKINQTNVIHDNQFEDLLEDKTITNLRKVNIYQNLRNKLNTNNKTLEGGTIKLGLKLEDYLKYILQIRDTNYNALKLPEACK